jgi:lipid-A-disaccharide synthase
MVNLVAEKKIVPEVMQDEATGERLAAEAIHLLQDAQSRNAMKQALAEVRAKLASPEHPMDRAARIVSEYLTRPEAVDF